MKRPSKAPPSATPMNEMPPGEIIRIAELTLLYGAESIVEALYAALDIVHELETSPTKELWKKHMLAARRCMEAMSDTNSHAPAFFKNGKASRERILEMMRKEIKKKKAPEHGA